MQRKDGENGDYIDGGLTKVVTLQTRKNMALAIDIEDLLNKQRIESNRIEFKKGWNPASIYHSYVLLLILTTTGLLARTYFNIVPTQDSFIQDSSHTLFEIQSYP